MAGHTQDPKIVEWAVTELVKIIVEMKTAHQVTVDAFQTQIIEKDKRIRELSNVLIDKKYALESTEKGFAG